MRRIWCEATGCAQNDGAPVKRKGDWTKDLLTVKEYLAWVFYARPRHWPIKGENDNTSVEPWPTSG